MHKNSKQPLGINQLVNYSPLSLVVLRDVVISLGLVD